MSRIMVVIPAYNEAGTIRDIAQRVLARDFELIVVDDGSTDGTADALGGLKLKLLQNPHNRGKGASLCLGFRRALEDGAETIVTLDGDGQHLPEDIPRLVEAHARQRSALIIGARVEERGNMPTDRHLANRIANFFIGWAAGRALADSQSGFRVYPATLLRTLAACCERATGFVFESEILVEAARAGAVIVAVPIAAIYESRGRRSHFRPVLDIARITCMIALKLLSRGLDLPGLVKSLRTDQK